MKTRLFRSAASATALTLGLGLTLASCANFPVKGADAPDGHWRASPRGERYVPDASSTGSGLGTSTVAPGEAAVWRASPRGPRYLGIPGR